MAGSKRSNEKSDETCDHQDALNGIGLAVFADGASFIPSDRLHGLAASHDTDAWAWLAQDRPSN